MTSVLSQYSQAQVIREFPRLLRGIVEWMSAEELLSRPAPGPDGEQRWSVAMVLTHLADVEEHGFRLRLRRIASEDEPLLVNYDPWVKLSATEVFRPIQALERFAAERARTVEFLESVPVEALSRTGRHEELGLVSFENYLNELPFHDLGHLRQIIEVYRAQVFYPKIGVYQNFYSIKP